MAIERPDVDPDTAPPRLRLNLRTITRIRSQHGVAAAGLSSHHDCTGTCDTCTNCETFYGCPSVTCYTTNTCPNQPC